MKKLFLFASLILGFAAAARAADVAFIAHPSLKESSLSAEEARNILLNNKTKWSSGPAVKLVVLSEGPVHDHVLKQFAQRTPDQFEKYWKKQVFTGVGSMPTQAKTDAEVIAYVAENPGAFGYVSKASVTDKVKVLTAQ